MQGISKISSDLPVNSHGTQMLSILTSSTNTQLKVGLIQYQQGSRESLPQLMRAFTFATQQKLNVIVYPASTKPSLLTSKDDLRRLYSEVIDKMKKFPGTIIVSSGNEGTNIDKIPVFPASFTDEIPNLLAVANVDT